LEDHEEDVRELESSRKSPCAKFRTLSLQMNGATIVPDDSLVEAAVNASAEAAVNASAEVEVADSAAATPEDVDPALSGSGRSAAASDPSDDADPASNSGADDDKTNSEPNNTPSVSHVVKLSERTAHSAEDPLAAADGCLMCDVPAKHELDVHIEKRAILMHEMLDIGDSEGIRHDYLTACDEIKFQCLTLNMDDSLCEAMKRKTSDTELHARFDSIFDGKVYIGSLGSTTCQIYPYTGVKRGSYKREHTLQLDLGARLARKLTMDMGDMAPHMHSHVEPHWVKLKAAQKAGAFGEGKVPLLLTNSVGFFLGDKEILDLSEILDDKMAGEAVEAIEAIKNGGCCMYNIEREDETFCLGNIRFMYLIKQIFSPFFDPVIVMNHRIFGKDSKAVPASYNTKWRISLGAELIATDERYKDGLVLIDYGGGKASGSATVFKTGADGGKGKEIKDETWVKENKLYPFPVQDDILAEDDETFAVISQKIQDILRIYRDRTNLPVFVAQTGPMRKAWSIEHHVCVCGNHLHVMGHPERYRANTEDAAEHGFEADIERMTESDGAARGAAAAEADGVAAACNDGSEAEMCE